MMITIIREKATTALNREIHYIHSISSTNYARKDVKIKSSISVHCDDSVKGALSDSKIEIFITVNECTSSNDAQILCKISY